MTSLRPRAEISSTLRYWCTRTSNISKVLKMIEQAAPAVPLKVRTFVPHSQQSRFRWFFNHKQPHYKTLRLPGVGVHSLALLPVQAGHRHGNSPSKNAGKRITPAMGKATMPSRFPTKRAVMRFAILIIKGASPRKLCH